MAGEKGEWAEESPERTVHELFNSCSPVKKPVLQVATAGVASVIRADKSEAAPLRLKQGGTTGDLSALVLS